MARGPFGSRERIGGGGATGLAAGDFLAQFGALGSKKFGCSTGISEGLFGLFLALCQFRDPTLGSVEPVPPAADFLGDFLTAARPALALAAQFVGP